MRVEIIKCISKKVKEKKKNASSSKLIMVNYVSTFQYSQPITPSKVQGHGKMVIVHNIYEQRLSKLWRLKLTPFYLSPFPFILSPFVPLLSILKLYNDLVLIFHTITNMNVFKCNGCASQWERTTNYFL